MMTRGKIQLLTVWNPYYEPNTIKVHADVLRAQRPRRNRYVWWGKMFSDHDATGVRPREQWSYLRDYWKQHVSGDGSSVLLATDFRTIHGLRIDRIKIGDLNREERQFAPPYYFSGWESRIALWFRIRDIRLVEHGLLQTMLYFREMGPVVGPSTANEGWFFSPYGSAATPYPLMVEGPSVEELFTHRPEGTLYADRDENIYPSPTLRMLGRLAAEYPDVWEHLFEESKLYLASSKLSEEMEGNDSHFDLAGALALACKAIERELFEGILTKTGVLELRDRKRSEKWTFGNGLDLLQNSSGGPSDSSNQALLELCRNSRWWTWGRKLARIRGEGVHRIPVSRAAYKDQWGRLFESGTGFGPLLRVKRELEA